MLQILAGCQTNLEETGALSGIRWPTGPTAQLQDAKGRP